MPLSRWAEDLKLRILCNGETIRATRFSAGTKNTAAFDPKSDTYDPARERDYNAANPLTPSTGGYFGQVESTEDFTAFFILTLSEEHRKQLSIAVFTVDHALLICPADFVFTGIIQLEYPIGSGTTYRLVNPDYFNWKDAPLYGYSVVERATRDL